MVNEEKREQDKISGFEAARARLTSIAYRMLGSRAEAEDVVQDAWLKWHAAAGDEVRTPLAWLTTVTTRLAIDRIRRLQSEQSLRTSGCLTQPWVDELAPSAEDEALHASAVSQAVALLFERLSADERAAFVLHDAFDFDYAQIAEVVGKTPGHCRQLAHRARQRLAGEQEGESRPQRRNGAPIEASRPGAPDVEGLRETIHRANAAGAVRLLADPERAGRVAAAVAGNTAVQPEHGAAMLPEAVPAFIEDATLETYALPSDCGAALALVQGCEIVGIMRLVFVPAPHGGQACRVMFITGGEQVEALNRRFGSRAIVRLLARIAGPTTVATACAA